MSGEDSILEPVFDDEGAQDFDYEDTEDVEMADVEEGELIEDIPNAVSGESTHLTDSTVDVAGRKFNDKLGPKKNKKKKKNRKKKKGSSGSSIFDINRFVLGVSRRLKETKLYLVYAAVGCLGVDALNDLVKEVDAIQACGGQKTVDERRYRTGGGILWNILKVRDPNAYKEIMKKGKEFEKQFNPQNVKKEAVVNTEGSTCASVAGASSSGASDCSHQSSLLHKQQLETPKTEDKRVSVHDRVRIPVAYDDLVVLQQEEDVEKCV